MIRHAGQVTSNSRTSLKIFDVKLKLHREHVRDIGDSLQSKNTKPLWNYVKSLRRDVFGVSPLTTTAGRIESSAKEKAEALNKQFCSVFTRAILHLFLI